MSSETIYPILKAYFETLPAKFNWSSKSGKTFIPKLYNLVDSNYPTLSNYDPKTIRFLVNENISPIFCKNCGADITQKFVITRCKYCNIKCYKQDPEAGKIIGHIKQQIYNDPFLKAGIEAKKIATNRRRSGYDHPMQDPLSHEKQQKSCFKREIIDGIEMQGYEPFVYNFLKNFDNYTISRGSVYLATNKIKIKWVDENGKWHHSFPDFFISELNSFIEVKSEYTLNKSQYKIEKAIDACNTNRFGYILAVYKPRIGIIFENFNHSHILDRE